MFGLGGGEIVLLLVLALIFVGPKKIPELAKGLGKGIREFQKAKNEMLETINEPEEVFEVKRPSLPREQQIVETTASKRDEEQSISPHTL